MSDQRKTVSIVVPFLNEEENLPALYERVRQAMNDCPENWELILVDDGSTDSSAPWASRKIQEDSRVKLLQLSRNFGHQIAITAGMDHAEGDAVVIMDADLQDPPEVLPELLRKWREGCEVVYAVRASRAGETWMKKFLAAAFYRIFQSLTRINTPRDAGDFRLLDRKVVLALRQLREMHRYVRGLTSWVGFRQGSVQYERAIRHAGTTKYPVWKSLMLAMDAITSFTATPLRWVTAFGALIATGGFAYTALLIVWKFTRPAIMVPGWATVVALLLILSGIQLLCVGLLGQYVSRIFEEGKHRPLYFISHQEGFNA